MRALLLTGLLAIAAPASMPASSTPLFSAPVAPVPVIPTPPGDKSIINPNPMAALGLCPRTAAQIAADRARKNGGRGLFRKLTESPPGNAYSAVYRHDANGCESPIVVKYGVGRR